MPVVDLLRDNGLSGLLYMSAIKQRDTSVTGDTLHLNNVEPFPAAMQPGVFAPGDLLVSLRNIDTCPGLHRGDARGEACLNGRLRTPA